MYALRKYVPDQTKFINYYAGYTTTRRPKLHLTDHSSICSHLHTHGILTKSIHNTLVDRKNIIASSTCKIRINILEALLIKKKKTKGNIHQILTRSKSTDCVGKTFL